MAAPKAGAAAPKPPANPNGAPQLATPTMNYGNPQQAALTPAAQGYNGALSSLQNSLNASNNTTSGAQMQLGQQLQQNQGQVAQNLTNRGLGNTTVAQTMQQAPLQTYNQGMANVANQGAERQMSAYGSLANMQAQGGQGLANIISPYAQSQYQQNYQQQQGITPMQQQQTANNQAYQQSLANVFQQMNNQGG